MRRRLKHAVIVLMALFAVAQLWRPHVRNPPADDRLSIHAQLGTTSPLVAVLDRSCGDCHSNHTVWPWYTQVAPVSWLMAATVSKGRQAVNFSEWTAYPLSSQRAMLAASCATATNGTMPGPYAIVRPDTRLSARDIELICSVARQTETSAADRR